MGKDREGEQGRWVSGGVAVLDRVAVECLPEMVTPEQRKWRGQILTWVPGSKSPRRRDGKATGQGQSQTYSLRTFIPSHDQFSLLPLSGSAGLTDSKNWSVNSNKNLLSLGSSHSKGNMTFFQINSFYSIHHSFENEGTLYTVLLKFTI